MVSSIRLEGVTLYFQSCPHSWGCQIILAVCIDNWLSWILNNYILFFFWGSLVLAPTVISAIWKTVTSNSVWFFFFIFLSPLVQFSFTSQLHCDKTDVCVITPSDSIITQTQWQLITPQAQTYIGEVTVVLFQPCCSSLFCLWGDQIFAEMHHSSGAINTSLITFDKVWNTHKKGLKRATKDASINHILVGKNC